MSTHTTRTTRTTPRLLSTIYADTRALIIHYEANYAIDVLKDLGDRLRTCESEQEQIKVCLLWRKLYTGERK